MLTLSCFQSLSNTIVAPFLFFLSSRRKTGKKTFGESIKLNPQREDDGLDNVSDGRTLRPDCAIIVKK